MIAIEHQYIDRATGRVCSERPIADGVVNYLYCSRREEGSLLYRLLGSRRLSSLLGWVNYDFPLGQGLSGIRRFMRRNAIDLNECLGPVEALDTARKIFERKIRYWQCRPMAEDSHAVVCPADSRVLVGSLKDDSALFLKGKFFDYEELLGAHKTEWLKAFRGGDFLVCRLTPDKYHYNHTPAAGIVRDHYECAGCYHSCNPGAAVTLAAPYSKNKRIVTIIDTDVAGGTRVGLLAMVEVVALMIGDIVQRYSAVEYRDPLPIRRGLFVQRGCPKSLFRPGSSTTVLLFQEQRVEFCRDIIQNLRRGNVSSRYSQGLGEPLVETDVQVRATVAIRRVHNQEVPDDL